MIIVQIPFLFYSFKVLRFRKWVWPPVVQPTVQDLNTFNLPSYMTEEKQQIFTFEKLNPEIYLLFVYIVYQTCCRLIFWRSTNWLCNWLISAALKACEHILSYFQETMNLGNVTGCWRKTTHGAINHVGQAFQLLFTQIHIHYLFMRGHTQTHTIYIYTHCVFGSLHIINTHTTNTVQDGGVKEKKK